jgi:phage host-nuclease inhibitor protein Gam
LKQLGRLGAIRTKEEVDKRAVMADVKAGAPLPEGCELVPGEERFYLDEGKEE